MSTLFHIAAVFGLAISPASCFPPQPDHLQDTRSVHHHPARASLRKRDMPDWEIPVILGALFVTFMSFGLIGGALEYILCTRRKRAAVHRDGSDVDFVRCAGSGSPAIGSDQATLVGGGEGPAGGGGKLDEELGRYSWQDDAGITTEVYMDGKVPGAGPPRTPRREMARVEHGGYHASSGHRALQEHRGGNDGFRGAAGVVSPLSPEEPQFVIHDEQDDDEYREEMANHPGRLVGYYGGAASSNDSSSTVVSPAEPEPTGGRRGSPWQEADSMLSPAASRAGHSNETYGGFRFDRESSRAALHDDELDEGARGGETARFEPWLPTVDLTIDDEPLDEIALVDHDTEGESMTRPSGEVMWRTHPTQFL